MKTRSQQQPERKKRSVAIRASKLKKHIKSRSVATSCCSSCAAPPLINNGKAEMEVGRHAWTSLEESLLVQFSKDPKMVAKYNKDHNIFYEEVAGSINELTESKRDGYVKLDAKKVERKFAKFLSNLKKHYSEPDMTDTPPLSREESLAFSNDEASSSRKRAKKTHFMPTVPTDYQSAIKYLNECRVDNIKLLKYSKVLEHQSVLYLFLIKNTYAEKIKLLEDALGISEEL